MPPINAHETHNNNSSVYKSSHNNLLLTFSTFSNLIESIHILIPSSGAQQRQQQHQHLHANLHQPMRHPRIKIIVLDIPGFMQDIQYYETANLSSSSPSLYPGLQTLIKLNLVEVVIVQNLSKLFGYLTLVQLGMINLFGNSDDGDSNGENSNNNEAHTSNKTSLEPADDQDSMDISFDLDLSFEDKDQFSREMGHTIQQSSSPILNNDDRLIFWNIFNGVLRCLHSNFALSQQRQQQSLLLDEENINMPPNEAHFLQSVPLSYANARVLNELMHRIHLLNDILNNSNNNSNNNNNNNNIQLKKDINSDHQVKQSIKVQLFEDPALLNQWHVPIALHKYANLMTPLYKKIFAQKEDVNLDDNDENNEDKDFSIESLTELQEEFDRKNLELGKNVKYVSLRDFLSKWFDVL